MEIKRTIQPSALSKLEAFIETADAMLASTDDAGHKGKKAPFVVHFCPLLSLAASAFPQKDIHHSAGA